MRVLSQLSLFLPAVYRRTPIQNPLAQFSDKSCVAAAISSKIKARHVVGFGTIGIEYSVIQVNLLSMKEMIQITSGVSLEQTKLFADLH